MSSIMFPILPPELEQHILSFVDERTLQGIRTVSRGTNASIQQFFNDRINALLAAHDRLTREKDPTWTGFKNPQRFYAMLPSKARPSLCKERELHFSDVTESLSLDELYALWEKYHKEDKPGLERFKKTLREITGFMGNIESELKRFIFTLRGDQVSPEQKKERLRLLSTVPCLDREAFAHRLWVLNHTIDFPSFQYLSRR